MEYFEEVGINLFLNITIIIAAVSITLEYTEQQANMKLNLHSLTRVVIKCSKIKFDSQKIINNMLCIIMTEMATKIGQ